MRNAARLLFTALALLAGTTQASPLAESEVPAPLKPWVGWVLHDQDQRGCPVGGDEDAARACDWPSRLTLEVNNGGGRFVLQLRLDAAGWAALPGSAESWPQDVKVDNRPAP